MKLLLLKIKCIPLFKEVFSDLLCRKLFKSIKIKSVYFAYSKPVFILSVNDVTQEFVENNL